jgi:hypothetical protein
LASAKVQAAAPEPDDTATLAAPGAGAWLSNITRDPSLLHSALLRTSSWRKRDELRKSQHLNRKRQIK